MKIIRKWFKVYHIYKWTFILAWRSVVHGGKYYMHDTPATVLRIFSFFSDHDEGIQKMKEVAREELRRRRINASRTNSQ